jgi:hypothetical protein
MPVSRNRKDYPEMKIIASKSGFYAALGDVMEEFLP